ncbi:MAG: GNAT family N-acetyltransferase, partial [Marmoricola sp.]
TVSTAVEPFRDAEERLVRQGRISYHALALWEDEVVGFTTVSVAGSDRSKGYQWGTLVAAKHRGHRLGLALKVANLRQIQQHEPQMRAITTWNAESNGPMISVNEQLGYVAVERLGEFEKRW